MKKRPSLRLLAAAIPFAVTLLWASGTAAGTGVTYPAFATPDGKTASSGTPGAVSVPALPNLLWYTVLETPAAPAADPPPGNSSHILWGYEAAFGAARIIRYTFMPFSMGVTCVPTSPGFGFMTSQNGRGIAFDPLDGDLWWTNVNVFFAGDGYIHKSTPPPPDGNCAPVTSIPFGDGPGGAIQDDIGALDLDEATKHIWAAGYKPVRVLGVMRSYLYLVNRNNGMIIQSCWLRFRGGGVGNDTLSAFTDSSLPGSSKYLLTDAGELDTKPNSLALIDQSDCHDGDQVRPIMEFPKNHGMSGIAFEWPGLLNTDLFTLYNNGNQPFSSATVLGPTGAPFGLEDISLCGFRAVFAGDGGDFCPY
jgi:hypothetical protein